MVIGVRRVTTKTQRQKGNLCRISPCSPTHTIQRRADNKNRCFSQAPGHRTPDHCPGRTCSISEKERCGDEGAFAEITSMQFMDEAEQCKVHGAKAFAFPAPVMKWSNNALPHILAPSSSLNIILSLSKLPSGL